MGLGYRRRKLPASPAATGGPAGASSRPGRGSPRPVRRGFFPISMWTTEMGKLSHRSKTTIRGRRRLRRLVGNNNQHEPLSGTACHRLSSGT